MNYRYHICVPNEKTVKVKKWTPEATQASEIPGTFRQNKINTRIIEVIKNPDNLKDEQIQKVGEALFEALFDNQLREDFLDFYETVVINRDLNLEVVLEINEIAMPEVVAYPWELISVPQRYNEGYIHLATDPKLSFFRIRYNLAQENKKSIQLDSQTRPKIALVVSIPTADSKLSKVEFQSVQKYLTNLNNENKIEFLPVIEATSKKVASQLRQHKPDIFHFIGHGQLIEENGKEVGQIAFVNDSGEADWKDATIFSTLFQQHRPKIVILQACETGRQSESNAFSSVAYRLMLQGIPVVIAMQYKVSNITAGSFVKDFYGEIVNGNSVEIAVQQARFNLSLENGYEQRDFAIPVIYMNASNGYLISHQSPTPEPIIIELIDRRTLREEINKFFKTEASLQEIFFFNDDIFGDNFYQNLPGTDYSTKVFPLIRELEIRNLTHDFIKAVREKYPNFAQN